MADSDEAPSLHGLNDMVKDLLGAEWCASVLLMCC